MRTAMIGVIALFIIPALASAANETPTSKTAFVTEPYEFGIGTGRGPFVVAMLDQGYVVTEHSEPEGDLLNDAGLVEWTDGLPDGYGCFLIVSHGSTNGIAIEAYVSQTDRNTAWAFYEAQGFPMSELYPSYSVHGYHISMRSAAIGGRFVAANTIVYNGSCYGHSYEATAWPGSRCRLGYSAACPGGGLGADLTAFWPRLAGGVVSERNVNGAKTGLSVELAGSGETTLTPYVSGSTLPHGAQIPSGGKAFTFTFDTSTNQGFSPLSVTGPFTLQNVSWNSATSLSATVRPTGDGEGYVTALASVITSANHNELRLDGGSNYDVRVRHGDNPAATVSGFSVSDGAARWKVTDRHRTDHFRIEAAADVKGPWSSAVDDIPANVGHSSTRVNADGPFYRLIEVETDGTELVHGIASRNDERITVEASPTPSVAFMREKIAELNRQREGTGYGGELPMSSSTLTVYTTPAFEDDAWNAFGYYWQGWWGIDVTMVTTDAFPQTPDGIRNGIKNDITTRYNAGERAFLILGDANDHVQFTGQQYPSLWLPENGWETIRQDYLNGGYQNQSSNDLIPTFYAPDTMPRDENQGWVTPYWMSDLSYGNVDSDPAIEALVTRLPFTTADEIYAYGYKLQGYNGGWYGLTTAGFHIGDLDHNGVSGQSALAIANAVEDRLPPNVWPVRLLESAYPSAAQRNTMAAQYWDGYRYEFLLLTSSISNRSWPGNFFDQTNGTNPWRMDMIHPAGTHAALVLAAACDGGDYPRTEDADYGLPIGHRFVSAWEKGAIAWVGPTAGTWQEGNEAFATLFAEELFANPSRSMAESYLTAVNRILVDFADQPEVVNTVLSYAFIGDPLVPMNRMMVPVNVEHAAGGTVPFFLGQNAPNPFQRHTWIDFSLPSRGPASLRIYTVTGRLVRTLADGVKPAGRYQLAWDGRDDRGHQVTAGIYLSRLSTSERALERKLLLLK